jgi:hypothetical protein
MFKRTKIEHNLMSWKDALVTFSEVAANVRKVGGSGQAAFDHSLQLAAARSFFVVRGLAVPDELRLWSCDDDQSNNG